MCLCKITACLFVVCQRQLRRKCAHLNSMRSYLNVFLCFDFYFELSQSTLFYFFIFHFCCLNIRSVPNDRICQESRWHVVSEILSDVKSLFKSQTERRRKKTTTKKHHHPNKHVFYMDKNAEILRSINIEMDKKNNPLYRIAERSIRLSKF